MVLTSLLVLAGACQAAAPVEQPHFKDMSEAQIAQALVQIHKAHPLLPDRILAVSGALLGIPYRLGLDFHHTLRSRDFRLNLYHRQIIKDGNSVRRGGLLLF